MNNKKTVERITFPEPFPDPKECDEAVEMRWYSDSLIVTTYTYYAGEWLMQEVSHMPLEVSET